MVDAAYIALVATHISCAATAFVITMPAAGTLRRVASLGQEAKQVAAQLATRTTRFALIFILATLVTGLALVFYRGGFKALPWTHVPLTLVTLMAALSAFVQLPTCKRIHAAIDGDAAAWKKARVRFLIGDGINETLWLVVLCLMFIK